MARIDALIFSVDMSVGSVPNQYNFWVMGGLPAAVPPEIQNVSPATSVPLFPHETVAFDVLDDGEFRRIILTAEFAGSLAPEVIHDGSNFSSLYSANSTKTVTVGGYHFVLLRAGGWPSEPTITPYAFDTTGQENP